MANKTFIADVDRGIYDVINQEDHRFVADKGLTEDIIRDILLEEAKR